jgi:hypothetical protein
VDRQVRGWHFEVIRLAERTRSTPPPMVFIVPVDER